MLQKKILAANAQLYIQGELSYGRDLSQLILKLNLALGLIYTYLPLALFENDFVDFELSFEDVTGERQSGEFLKITIEYISNYLSTNNRNLVLFETLANKGDPVIEKQNLQHFFFQTVKYDYLRGSDNEKPVSKYIKAAQGYPAVFALTRYGEKTSNIDIEGKDLDDEAVNELMANISGLIIGAYDGEGYLFWERTESLPRIGPQAPKTEEDVKKGTLI